MMWDESQLKVDIELCIKPRCFQAKPGAFWIRGTLRFFKPEGCIRRSPGLNLSQDALCSAKHLFRLSLSFHSRALAAYAVSYLRLCLHVPMCAYLYFHHNVITLFGGQQGKCTYWGCGGCDRAPNIFSPPAGMKVNWCLILLLSFITASFPLLCSAVVLLPLPLSSHCFLFVKPPLLSTLRDYKMRHVCLPLTRTQYLITKYISLTVRVLNFK